MTTEAEQALEVFNPPETNRIYPELFALHREIHEFSKNLDDLERLLEIQKRLINAIFDAEEEIKTAKSGGLDPKDWQYLRYNFLCLGDSLAFLYIDRFALKQTFFNTDTTNPKQSGGFISGKAGLAGELSLLKDAIAHNVPAVLCDLTNVIRYGDICLLGASDPVPIEVKSSNTKDSRGKRQKKKLSALTEFLETDRATDFRGLTGTTRRTEFSTPPRSFGGQLEAAIADAESCGISTFDVDGCLKIAVISGEEPDYDLIFGDMTSTRVIGNFVNQLKTNMIWGCYFPYALTLSNPDHYEKFVRGEINIVALLIMDDFETKLAPEGVGLEIEADEESLQCRISFSNLSGDLEEAFFIIGEHMMCRMWSDFLCPSWIVQNSIDTVLSNVADIEKDHADFISKTKA